MLGVVPGMTAVGGSPVRPGAVPDGLPPYEAHPRWRGRHRMTIYTWGRPRTFPGLPRGVPRFFDVAPGARVLAMCHWQVRPWQYATIVLFHGLEASSEAHYMRGIAEKAWKAGLNVVRLNQRNCGGTEHLSPGLYHSGLTSDPIAVLRELIAVDHLPAIGVAGYSLGGNLALKLAGDLGAAAPAQLRAVYAVSPTMDLQSCVDALELRENRVYEWNFVRQLKARMRRKARLFPDLYDLGKLAGIRSVRAFDDAYTAPHHGFQGAEDYYYRASALRVVGRIGVPTHILTSADDPFVPAEPFRDAALADHPHVQVTITADGGHCGFVTRPTGPGDDGYWAEHAIVDFVARQGC